MSFIACLKPQTPIKPVLIVKYIAAKIRSAIKNSTFTPLIVIYENIIPDTLSAIGDSKLSITASKLIILL